jgi:hypothetical protein
VLWLIQAGVMRDSYVRGRIDSVDQAIQQVVEDRTLTGTTKRCPSN